MGAELLDRGLAETYAGWFRALADPSRVQILHLLASAGRPMPVGEIVRRVHIGQSTVSHHLAVLADTRFVLVERAGTARLYRVNEACVSCFPSAADVVMGRVPAVPEEVGNARGPG
jgi:DNA-binding transcriptional ArsR family regulator